MKFKNIPLPYIKVILDRLMRLKPAYERYDRVFSDIINKFLICDCRPDEKEKISLAAEIFNASVGKKYANDSFLNDYIIAEEKRLYFSNPLSEKYLDVPLNLADAFNLIKNEANLKTNLKQMLALNFSRTDAKKMRQEHALLFPVEKILLCEGATEEILLCELAKNYGYDFNKNGVYVIGAGGKNQVARHYYTMIEQFRIPIFVLLDSDAQATKELILPKLRAYDRVYVIKSGEFEDILPKNLIVEALNERYKSGYHCSCEDFCQCEKTAKMLYEIYKQKGFGEFKKADFAKTLKSYLYKNPLTPDKLSDETIRIIEKIKTL